MNRVAKFEKVSLEQFKKDWINNFGDSNNIEDIYHSIKLPTRATVGSAGYDFFAPVDINIEPKKSVKIPTGIRVKIDGCWVLNCFPRSGLGFKYRLQLDNTVGIIDSDYYYSENEGHILIKLTNDTYEDKQVHIDKGTGFVQGIFFEYGLAVDDDVKDIRNGGFGSTTRVKQN